MWPCPVQSASHAAKIPVHIVIATSGASQSLVASASASVWRCTTLVVSINSSSGLLCNPPVFSLLVTSCLNQSRQLALAESWAIYPGGEGNYCDDVFCFAVAVIHSDWLT